MLRALSRPALLAPPLVFLALAFLAGTSCLCGATMPEPISYTVRFPAPATHYAEIEASIPTGGQAEIELAMAVWTPGSYLVREFSRNVEAVTARSDKGAPLKVEKTRKNRWRIET